jgi:urease accessory protein
MRVRSRRSAIVELAEVLGVLQHGDSSFPAGGFAFSWGVEGLAADRFISDEGDLQRVIEEHLTNRWQTMDRPLLVRAYRAADIAAVIETDRYCDVATPCAEMRDGSRRAGRALLGTNARLGGPLCIAYQAETRTDRRLGHLPVVQALVYRDAGLSIEAARLLSGWTLVTSLTGAAARIGVIGHVQAQQILSAARGTLTNLLLDASADERRPSSFTPFIDIAIARGRLRHSRLFAT